MKKLTIAERREKELDILISYKTSNPTPADYKEARKIMNSYYRLCGLANRNLMLTNNENTYNRVSTHKSEERESKWFKRLQKTFKEIYGLDLFYVSWYPSIGAKDTTNGGIQELVHAIFYN